MKATPLLTPELLNEMSSQIYDIIQSRGLHDHEPPTSHYCVRFVSDIVSVVEAGERWNATRRLWWSELRDIEHEASDSVFSWMYDAKIKGTLPEQIAILILRVLHYAKSQNINFDHYVEVKIKARHTEEVALAMISDVVDLEHFDGCEIADTTIVLYSTINRATMLYRGFFDEEELITYIRLALRYIALPKEVRELFN